MKKTHEIFKAELGKAQPNKIGLSYARRASEYVEEARRIFDRDMNDLLLKAEKELIESKTKGIGGTPESFDDILNYMDGAKMRQFYKLGDEVFGWLLKNIK
jgi:hypothetical protein